MAINQREQHAGLQTTPAAPGRGEIYKRRGISSFRRRFAAGLAWKAGMFSGERYGGAFAGRRGRRIFRHPKPRYD
jgi:hypothetical protein